MRISFAKLSAIKNNLIILTLLAFSVYILLMYMFIGKTFSKYKKMPTSSVKISNVIVHIDLKGTPLHLSYIEALFPTMKKYGVNGILMEYEDMFPYEGKLVNLSAEYHYKKNELKQFLRSAKEFGFDIIPLVQTFGHLEFALKLAEFQHLRENPMYSDSICPSKMESLVFLHELITQIIDFHMAVSPLKYIHIGCDEVFHINQCNYCKERPDIISNKDLFIQHIRSVSEIVNSLTPQTTILIWDDMLRSIKAYEWVDIEPFSNVLPVYWDYGTTLRVTHQNLYMYYKKFPNIWIASAYKGADGRTASIPDFESRFLNHFRWMKYILGYRFGDEDAVYSFGAIILTGWSRYSHMDPPCELLPVSIPSLIINLLIVEKFRTGIHNSKEIQSFDFMLHNHIRSEFKNNFKCLSVYNVLDFENCGFKGQELYSIVRQYVLINNEIAMKLSDEQNSIMSLEYYSKDGIINMNNVQQMKGYLENKLNELMFIENQTLTEISKYYHINFAREYIGYKSYHNKDKIKKLLKVLRNFSSIRSWS